MNAGNLDRTVDIKDEKRRSGKRALKRGEDRHHIKELSIVCNEKRMQKRLHERT